MAECTWWKGQVVIHTSISTLLAVIWFIQLLRTIHAEAETLNMQAGQDAGYFSSLVGMEFLNVRELSVRMKLEHGLARE